VLAIKKMRQEVNENLVADELLAGINEVLNAVKAGKDPIAATGDLSGHSPALRSAMELINEIALHMHKEFEYMEAKLKLIIRASNIALWDMKIVDGDPVNPSNTFHWSNEFRYLLGYSNEIDFPNILCSWSDKLHPEDKKRTLDSFARHILDRSGRTPYDIEYRVQKKNGDYAYFHAFGTTIRDKQGHALKVAGAVQDITEAKKTEIEKITTDLRLTLLQKSIHVALWDMVVDPSDPVGGDNCFWWSSDFRNVLGFNDERDFPNVLCSWSDRLHPEDKERTLNAFARHIMDKTGMTPYNVEYRVKRKTGEYIWLKADGTTLRDKNGMPLRVVGSIENITDKLNEKTILDNHVEMFSKAIDGMTHQIEAIIKATAGVANAQASNLSISVESEKNAAETTSIILAMQNVASQSNVLGINASIEAARAGHLGKGFAVVSEEVRKLALNSKISADQIESKVKSVQNSTKQISEAIKETDVLVNTQKDIIAKLKEDLIKVNSMYGELVKMIVGKAK